MSVLSALKTYIGTYDGLDSDACILVDSLNETTDPVQYGIIPLPGARNIEEYINGSVLREFPFALQFTGDTASEDSRLANNEFFEDFAEWLDLQTLTGVLPTLESGKTAERIRAINAGYLLQQGESQTAIYQITCALEYSQDAPS